VTTLLDAYALIGYLADEACADEVEALLRAGGALSALNVAESIDRMHRVHGIDVDRDLDSLVAAGVEVVEVDLPIGRRAGRLRARRYHRERMPVSMADCVAAATAVELGIPLATSDRPLARLVVAEGGSIAPLPDSRGRRPSR
jgi:predicted nucleic acid-binding protein